MGIVSLITQDWVLSYYFFLDISHENSTWLNWQFNRLTFGRDIYLHKIDIWKGNTQRKLIVNINLHATKLVTDLRYTFCQSYYIITTLATALIQSEIISFDQNILTVINDLKKKEKRADIDSVHKEIIKTIDFKDTTKDDLQDRINIVLINEKLINKINRNLNCYSVDEANTNTEYGTTRVLSSNLSFANSNNDSTPDSSITP